MSEASVKVSEELQELAKKLDRKLEEIAGQRVGFSLFVWTDGMANYVSNSTDRREIRAALGTVMAHWANGMPDIPAHERQ